MESTKSKNGQVTRRDFIKGASAVAAFTIVPSHVLGGVGNTAPSDKLNIAGVGIGGMGKNNIKNCETENIVALCDIDQKYAAPVWEKYPQAKIYYDFRVMLEKQKDIDAVIVATPEHNHALLAVAAMALGKHF